MKATVDVPPEVSFVDFIRWLEDTAGGQGRVWETVPRIVGGRTRWVVHFEDSKLAAMFKLAWGGK